SFVICHLSCASLILTARTPATYVLSPQRPGIFLCSIYSPLVREYDPGSHPIRTLAGLPLYRVRTTRNESLGCVCPDQGILHLARPSHSVSDRCLRGRSDTRNDGPACRHRRGRTYERYPGYTLLLYPLLRSPLLSLLRITRCHGDLLRDNRP